MDFFKDYLNDMTEKIKNVPYEHLNEVIYMLNQAKKKGNKVYLVGNGGSASIAGHFTVDLTKNANIRAVNFNESATLTAFANDFGYEKWVEKAIGYYADPGDVVILISSSGKSMNIINGAKRAKAMDLNVITFSGFKTDNPLKQMGDINLYVDSMSYNIVEMTHSVWLAAIVDRIVDEGKEV